MPKNASVPTHQQVVAERWLMNMHVRGRNIVASHGWNWSDEIMMRKHRRASITLETIGKAVLVLAVVVILLLIFRGLIGEGAKDFGKLGKDTSDKANTCWKNPSAPECQWLDNDEDAAPADPKQQ
jgi:hypothetical protein